GTSSGGPSFTYEAPLPPPTVTSVTPSKGPTAGGTSVTLKGSGFLSPASVSIGGAAATAVEVLSEGEIKAVTPAGLPRPAHAVVAAANGTSSGGPSFTYEAPLPPPTVTSVTPSKGPTAGGTSVTLKGSGFLSPASVSIGGAAATAVEVLSEGEI